jgi:serine/threonine protein kinase
VLVALTAGSRIGSYKITAYLGAGGMGEVYRATDTQLSREVAIKVLRADFAQDVDRLARFEREARALASLNHPNIATIHGFESSDGGRALVLELVEGPTLAERIAQRAVSVDDALAIAKQIAEALEAAHAQGIIHRDLKPANVKVRSDGTVKILDFGLAKTITPTDMMAVGAPTSPTVTSPDMTHAGMILGTAGYMSPEQTKGVPVDKRTDIWAFGCVLFEMLCGRPPFEAETATDTLVRILEREPDWTCLPPATPDAVRRLLQRCLRKDPKKRLHDIADARIEIEECDLVPSGSNVKPRVRPHKWIVTVVLVVSSLALILFIGWQRAAKRASEVFQFSVDPPANASFPPRYAGFALSPDGRQLVVTVSTNNRSSLWVRPVATPEYREIPGTDDALFPFWKPDGLEIGFFARGKLQTVPVHGGIPTVVCDAPDIAEGSGHDEVGGTWNHDDVIVFMSSSYTLHKVSANGGSPPVAITTLANGETAHRWPSFLPDDQHFLYLAIGKPGALGDLRIGSVTGGTSTSLGRFESNARYASGHLLFLSGGQLVARRFDPKTGTLSGPSAPIVTTPKFTIWSRLGAFSVSDTGVLASHPGGPIASEQRLTWRDRSGRVRGTIGELGRFPTLDLSRDGKHVAVAALSKAGDNTDIWIIDVSRGDAVPLTTDPAWEFDPSWSHDDEWIAFNSNRTAGRFSLFVRRSDGSGSDQLLATGGSRVETPVWLPHDRSIVYGDDGDLWIASRERNEKSRVVWATPAQERAGAFSPDGRWTVYVSDKPGRPEIYVRAFPSGDAEYKVSRDGGMAPRWSGDGKEIFFLSLDATMMAARVETGNGFRAMMPEPLFATGLPLTNLRPYAVAPDGQRFLIPTAVDPRGTPPITVLLNWPAKIPR